MERDLVLFITGRITELVNRYLTAQLRRHGMGDLAVSHAEIIGILTRRGSVQLKELVELIGKDKSTITALTKKLLGMGYIRKMADPSDSRVTRIELTAKGKELGTAMGAISARLRKKAYRGLSDGEKDQLVRLLNKIRGNF
jgi:MarR family transcriptional regulator, organic hydroperoxide resistance regulator